MARDGSSPLIRADLAISVVVPVHNGTAALTRCIAALVAQIAPEDEIIVVDDGSTEDVAGAVAAWPRVKVHRLDACGGVAAARNYGAAMTKRPILFFADADVIVHPDVVQRGRIRMADRSIDALIGSYDSMPAAASLVSRFKNLAHHYFHQRAAGDVSSFWSACGFVRREAFVAAGGFDAGRFIQPSIEDVELGWRLNHCGARIVLDPGLQLTHLKKWTLGSLIVTDVMQRAVPWTRWSLQRGWLPAELNVSTGQRVAAVITVLWIVAATFALRPDVSWVPVGILTLLAFAMNWRLFGLFWRSGGVRLFVAGFFLQQLYYLCALTGFAIGVALHYLPGRRRASARAVRAV